MPRISPSERQAVDPQWIINQIQEKEKREREEAERDNERPRKYIYDDEPPAPPTPGPGETYDEPAESDDSTDPTLPSGKRRRPDRKKPEEPGGSGVTIIERPDSPSDEDALPPTEPEQPFVIKIGPQVEDGVVSEDTGFDNGIISDGNVKIIDDK